MLKYTPNNAIYLKHCKALLYLDNSLRPMNYVKHYCNPFNTNDVQFIHVGETADLSPVSFSDPFFDRYKNAEGVPVNKYMAYIAEYAREKDKDTLDINSGIQKSKHDKQIKKWIAHIQNRVSRGEINDEYPACILLDWDRTLTMFEGVVHCPLAQFQNHDFTNDALVYLFGGEERLEYIRGIIQTCIDNKIIPFVFTNNKDCKEPYFKLLYTSLHRGLQLIGSDKGIKHTLLPAKELFAHLCKETSIGPLSSTMSTIKYFNNIAERNAGENTGENTGENAGGNGKNNTPASGGAGTGASNGLGLTGGRRKTGRVRRAKRAKSRRLSRR